ncbi:hypothetical protein ACVLVH_000501 [Kluyvera sp. 1366]
MTANLHLDTPRLTCSQIAEDDWDFFRQLQLSPHVMHYVADAKSDEKIHADFTARLPRWSPFSAHWLCLVVRENSQAIASALAVIFIGKRTAPKSAFCSHLKRKAKAMRTSRSARFVTMHSATAAFDA